MDTLAATTAGLMLSYVFLTAALRKLRHFQAFEATLANYRLLPSTLVHGTACIVSALEAIIGAGLLIPPVSRAAAVAAGLLLGVYTLAIGVNLRRGRRAMDCGCGAPGRRQSLNAWLLLRNAVLLALAGVGASPVSGRELQWTDWSIVIPATVAASFFYAAADQLLANRDLLARLGDG